MIHGGRIKRLNRKAERKGARYVLYWMQASQRAEYNHALEYAAEQANRLNLPLVTVFGLTASFPEANARHYAFMLEGLKEVEGALANRGVRFVVLKLSPEQAAQALSKGAALVVADRGYLRIQRAWRREAARKIACPLVQVESDVVVPVETASQKEEYMAATLRPKINRLLEEFLFPVRKTPLKRDALAMKFDGLALSDTDRLLASLSVDRSVPPVAAIKGGTREAGKGLRRFIRRSLDGYGDRRNDPGLDGLSHMSPYLHFGQISPLYVALKVYDASKKNMESRRSYLEELIVRRELSMNFVFFNTRYDTFDALPNWAKETLRVHGDDKREFTYSRKAFEEARTHDPYWNAAQEEMCITGKMHGYLRMYWGKKILEWSRTPRQAFRTALYLNNKYELDGRDPNGFTGVAWCFGKHDRAWGERPVYGKVRSMVASGLRRKFDMDRYLEKVAALKTGASGKKPKND